MNTAAIEKLKKEYECYQGSWTSASQTQYDKSQTQYDKFLEVFPKDKLSLMTLEEYTNLKGKDSGANYFTYWLERGTDKCGKFRTASSYAYGIYKVNPNNKPKGVDDKKWGNAETGYRTTEIRQNAKDEFVKRDEAKTWFAQNVKTKLIALSNFDDLEDLKPLEINYARKVAYLYNPGKLIPIYKKEVIQAIADFFDVVIVGQENSYKVTVPILEKIKEQFKLDELGFETTQKIAAFLWEKFGNQEHFDLNTIFYGPPGTGKTYTITESVASKLLIEEGKMEFVQFHPSFGYEDFIDGLKPELENGHVNLKLKNGVFKQFCIDATNALKKTREENKDKAKKDQIEPPKYYFLVDEINRADLSAVLGEVLSCLEEDKRLDFEFKDDKLVKKKGSLVVATQNSYLISNDDDAVYVETGDDGCKYLFGIPSNIVFIGTMNDIDRSVDTFDFALRRRFTWVHKGFDAEALANCDQFSELDSVQDYIDSCETLNTYISDELGLGHSYEIGHAYFMKVKVHGSEVSRTSKGKLFDQHLAPLLEEYLRSEYSTKDIEQKIKVARTKFVGN